MAMRPQQKAFSLLQSNRLDPAWSWNKAFPEILIIKQRFLKTGFSLRRKHYMILMGFLRFP